jgi:phage N-6-adenine-methyltransferase
MKTNFNPNIIYGRLAEATHISGYSFELLQQEFNQITKYHKSVIPDTIESVTGKLNGLGELLVASEWYRAAVVSAWVGRGTNQYKVPDENSPSITISDFANLNIKGLSTRDTVRHYLAAWKLTGNPKPVPGEEIELPNDPFPEWGTTKGKPHISYNSGENEWYTPLKFIESARLVMGSINLDPASSDEANEIVKAENYYTVETNGLEQEWHGNVWLNPPYSQPLISHFSNKLIEQLANINQACVLTNNATETEWYQRMLERCNAVCFIKGRIKFLDLDGDATGAPLQGQSMIYFGKNINEFDAEFSKYGICM